MLSQNPKIIYFRRKNKNTYALTFKKYINTRSLQLLLSKRQQIQLINLVLIYKGKILKNQNFLEQLQNKSIVHLIDMNQVRRQTIDIYIRFPQNTVKNFSVRSEDNIRQFVKSNLVRLDILPYFHIGLIYVGKMLQQANTFAHEYVEDGCEIILINIDDYLKRSKQDQKSLKANDNKIKLPDKGHNIQLHSQKSKCKDGQIEQIKTQKVVSNQQQQHLQDESQQNSGQNIKTADIRFNIQVSQVESVSTEQNQRNAVVYHQEQQVFQSMITEMRSPQKILSQQIFRQNISDSEITAGNFIYIGHNHQNQTKSLIDKLMKKYTIIFQPK